MDTATLRLFDMLAHEEKVKHDIAFSTRNKTIHEVINLIRPTLKEIQNLNWKTHEEIWRPLLFLNTVALDHSVMVHALAFEDRPWERNLVARQLCVLMYETTEDLPTLFGAKFNQALSKLNLDTSLIQPFREELKKVSVFFKKHQSFLKKIRTICGAHREHDSILLLETIESLDLLDVLCKSIEVGNILNDIGPALQAIITCTSNIKPPEIS